jgi:hypothetical protein
VHVASMLYGKKNITHSSNRQYRQL